MRKAFPSMVWWMNKELDCGEMYRCLEKSGPLGQKWCSGRVHVAGSHVINLFLSIFVLVVCPVIVQRSSVVISYWCNI